MITTKYDDVKIIIDTATNELYLKFKSGEKSEVIHYGTLSPGEAISCVIRGIRSARND